MPRKKHHIHYLYRTTCVITNKFYIGIHSTSNLNDGYLGSGKRLRHSIRKYGKDAHIKVILGFFDSRKETEKNEEIVINEHINDINCLNLTNGGVGFKQNHTQKSKDKIREFFKGKTYEEIFGDRADSERLKRKKTNRTHEEYLESGKKCSETTKGISKQFKDVVCPYCEKQGGVNVMYRWHFDNCKLKK
jgi:hypothetical protein